MSRGSGGRRPGAQRGAASRDVRSRAPLPRKLSPRAESAPRQATTLTARAAVLALAVASVIVAIALPFKIWLSQRDQINSLAAQNAAIAQHVQALTKADQRWQDPSYIESQARKRLHYVLPGQKTYVVLGKSKHRAVAGTSRPTGPVLTAGPWYSQLWQSMQIAGGTSASKK
jgi:cell division protein FtsB